MKLRNKKTGEIGEFTYFADKVYVLVNNELKTNLNYTSLAKLNKEWEDYEEPKGKHWYMTSWGEVWQYGDDPLHEEWRRTLGNDFETKEEAERAVEKLRAWKRLKDAGFRFTSYDLFSGSSIKTRTEGEFAIGAECDDFVDNADLDLLFGGEE